MSVSRLSNVRDLRRSNRSVVLSALYFSGPLTRQDLSRVTGLSGATVSNVVSQLIEFGAVVEAGALDSEGGRPRILLRVNPTRGYAVGVSLGPKRLMAGIFDLSLRELCRVDRALRADSHDPAESARLILAVTEQVVATAGIDRQALLGVGVGVSGVVEHGGGDVLVSAQTMGWEAVPLSRLIGGAAGVPVHIDNGAKNLGQAEMWFGAGRGARQAVVVMISSGVGAAMITDGSLYQGAGSSAGEWGHMTVEVGGRRCGCGSRGCLEAYVGAAGILDRYRQLSGRRPDPQEDEREALAAIAAGAEHDAVARQILDEAALYLGVGIANLVNLINPERVIIGGWAGLLLGAELLPAIREHVRLNSLRAPYGQTSIELAKLGDDAAIVGAAALPIAQFLRAGAATTRDSTRDSEAGEPLMTVAELPAV